MEYNCNYVVIDCETGGFSADKNPVVEVAMYIINSNLEKIAEYETLIKPYGDLIIQPQALEVNKLSLLDIQNGTDIKEVVKDMCNVLKSLKVGKYTKPIMVGHNIEKFDSNFLIKMFEYCNKDLFQFVDKHFEDTMWICRKKWGNIDQIPNFKLVTCCTKAGVDLVQAHTAMADTEATAKLFIYLMKCLRQESEVVQKQVKVREKFKF